MAITITADEAAAYGFAQVSEPAYLVIGECGHIHRSFEEWKKCQKCMERLRHMRRRFFKPVTVPLHG
jgi:hypothetical protein